MLQVLRVWERGQVSMPGHICAVVVTTLVLEGWSSKLDPTHSVMDQARRACITSNHKSVM